MLSDSPDRHPPRRLGMAFVLCLALLGAVLLTGCGSSEGSSSSGTTAGTAESSSEEQPESSGSTSTSNVSAAELQQTVNNAFETNIRASTLPPLVQEALERATPEPSQSTMETALHCWEANSCTVGEGPITIGLADGFGDNTWRQFVKMNIILQALTYPEVGRLIFTNAHGNLSTYLSNIRSLTSQGADAIVGYNDFGAAAYPAFEAAQREGAVVSTYVGPGETAPSSAITTTVQNDNCTSGEEMAEVTKEAVGASGPVAYFEGTPGNPQDAAWQKCATESGIESVFQGETDWTPAGAQKAASALVASGKPVKAILYSYSNPVPSIVNVYLQAHRPIPAIITWIQNNETNCQWVEHPYTLYETNSLVWAARVSVTATVSKLEGSEVPKEVIYPQPLLPARKSWCDKSKPAEYPGPSAMVPEYLTDKMLEGQ